jgi:hypothetical protein
MADQPRDDLGRFLSPDKDKSHLNFNSQFGGNLSGFLSAAEKAGRKIGIKSGYRSVARQKQLFDAAVKKYGSVKAARKMVAPPGKSRHNLGIAADLFYGTPEDIEWAHANAKKFGLNFRMPWENWHIEPLGALSKLGLGIGELLNPKPNPNLPETMQAPQSLAQTLGREQALAQAYTSPTRALDVIQSRPALNMPARPQTLNPPQRLAPAPVGKVTRTSLPSIPASLTPAPVGKVERAPLGPVGQFSQPAPSLQHPTSVAKPTNLAAAPVGKVTKGPALAPATPNASTLAAQYGQYRPSTATSMPTVATPPSVPVGALPAAKPSTATLAAQYAQYRPGTVPPAPVAPVTPPALALPPAQVLAPLLAPPKVVKDYPVAEVQQAPAPPRATAYDVYSGMADTALDNTGLNTVSSMPGGGTSVTNQYGATTGMKNGYQTAVGSLPGITGPTASKFGSAVKGAIPGVAGSALGGLLGGPVGALLGAALAKAVTQPGGILSGQTSFNTNAFGTINAAKAKGGLGFPGAPSGGYGSGGKMGASFSNNSANGMRGISPAAADAIGKGQGGLY